MIADKRTLRCAIYTRKSSEEGLDQEFNSLHAQREACQAFIRSQQGEGWQLHKIPDDDGGLSGATMERPALKRLLGDIEESLVRCGGCIQSLIGSPGHSQTLPGWSRSWTAARFRSLR